MTDELENIDSQNDADEVVTSEEETTTEDSNELTEREKQFLARAKKAEGKLKEVKTSIDESKPEIIKTNTEQPAPTLEQVALLTQNPDLDKLKFAEDYSKIKGISVTEAYNNPVVQAEFREMDNQKNMKANSLPASNGSAPAPREKTASNMTDDEHREMGEEMLKNAINK